MIGVFDKGGQKWLRYTARSKREVMDVANLLCGLSVSWESSHSPDKRFWTLEINAQKLEDERVAATKVPEKTGAEDVIEALDNVTAALETCLAHYGPSMPEADQISRGRLAKEARALVEKARDGEKREAEPLAVALRGMLEWARRVKVCNPGMEVAEAHNALTDYDKKIKP